MAIKPIKVGQINSYIKRVLQTDPLLGNVSVVGEISNLKYHNTGHVYFSLKDESGKLNCFLSYENVSKLRYKLSEGMEIIAYGYVSVYERGGTYSLNIKDIEVNGQGNLSIAFDELKNKLEKDGLFDRIHKKPLPDFPDKIALVTSETGAALQDMLKIIKSRNNLVNIIIFPVTVQGPKAACEIAGAIDYLNNNYKDIDLMIIGRGGGSTEELWAFNEEIVALSIFNSAIPIISAVGHETDITISDFVSDVRAETPTAAAALAVPDLFEIREFLDDQKFRMLRMLKSKVETMESLINIRKAKLEGLNPRRIISSGYGAILNSQRMQISSIDELKCNDEITIVLKDGEIVAKAIEIKRRQI